MYINIFIFVLFLLGVGQTHLKNFNSLSFAEGYIIFLQAIFSESEARLEKMCLEIFSQIVSHPSLLIVLKSKDHLHWYTLHQIF